MSSKAPIIPAGIVSELYDAWRQSPEGRIALEPSILKAPEFQRYLRVGIESAYLAGAGDARFWVLQDLQNTSIGTQRLCAILRSVQEALHDVERVSRLASSAGLDKTGELPSVTATRLSAALERAEALANLLAELLPEAEP
ncbi:MAG: hypothetical protein Fues2KO_45530 [Fuerstiella sp.]